MVTPATELETTVAVVESEEEASGRSRRGRRGGRRRKRSEAAADAVPAHAEIPSEPSAGIESGDHSVTGEPAAPTITTESAAPQRRIRSGRPRLPREVLAAHAASKAANVSAPLNDELPAPPLTRLEYPTVDEDRKETSKGADSPATEAPVQLSAQAEAEASLVESASSATGPLPPAGPAFTEAEASVVINTEAVQAPVILEAIIPETGDTAPTLAVLDSEVRETEAVVEATVAEVPPSEPSEAPAAPEAAIEDVENIIPAAGSEPPLPVEPVTGSAEPVESTPASLEGDTKP